MNPLSCPCFFDALVTHGAGGYASSMSAEDQRKYVHPLFFTGLPIYIFVSSDAGWQAAIRQIATAAVMSSFNAPEGQPALDERVTSWIAAHDIGVLLTDSTSPLTAGEAADWANSAYDQDNKRTSAHVGPKLWFGNSTGTNPWSAERLAQGITVENGMRPRRTSVAPAGAAGAAAAAATAPRAGSDSGFSPGAFTLAHSACFFDSDGVALQAYSDLVEHWSSEEAERTIKQGNWFRDSASTPCHAVKGCFGGGVAALRASLLGFFGGSQYGLQNVAELAEAMTLLPGKSGGAGDRVIAGVKAGVPLINLAMRAVNVARFAARPCHNNNLPAVRVVSMNNLMQFQVAFFGGTWTELKTANYARSTAPGLTAAVTAPQQVPLLPAAAGTPATTAPLRASAAAPPARRAAAPGGALSPAQLLTLGMAQVVETVALRADDIEAKEQQLGAVQSQPAAQVGAVTFRAGEGSAEFMARMTEAKSAYDTAQAAQIEDAACVQRELDALKAAPCSAPNVAAAHCAGVVFAMAELSGLQPGPFLERITQQVSTVCAAAGLALLAAPPTSPLARRGPVPAACPPRATR
jgi:hypothetical protein